MKNLINFFFSFDKLFKEKLVVPFFWLAIVSFGLKFSITLLGTIQLDILAVVVGIAYFVASLLFSLVSIRIVAELIVAVFRINDNLSPDKGKSELADIDPIGEARKAAEAAAARTREATKSVSEKASDATKSLRENVGEMSESVQSKAKSATASVREKADDLSSSAKDKTESVIAKTAKPKASPKPADFVAEPKKRGRPAGSKNKTATAKTTPKKAPTKKAPTPRTKTAPKKRGPKPGSKAPRDADGNLLKKDGTPRKKPGPKKT